MKLTDAQMLALWRRAQNLEPERSDCSIEVFEGYDITSALNTAMRQWYLNLLDTAPLQYLQTTDISTQINLKQIATGVWQCSLNANVRRLISLQIEGCTHTTTIINHDNAQREIALNTNRYSRRGTANPAAVQQGKTITLYCKTSDGAAPAIAGATAIVDPGDEWYVFDESALSLIPKAENLYE
jgi:hypothetical protein